MTEMTSAPEVGAAVRSRRARLRRHLALISAVSTGVVMLAFCIPLAVFVRNIAYDRAIDGAELQSRSLAAGVSSTSDRAAITRLVRRVNRGSSTPVTAFLVTGARIGPAAWPSVTVPPAVRHGNAVLDVAPDGGRLAWAPVHDPVLVRAIVAYVSPGALSAGVGTTWALLFGVGAALVLVAVAVADRLGRSIVRPLQELVVVTNRLRDGDLTSRTRPGGPYEVTAVGESVNKLADRIAGLVASARQGAADLGHRLRTPLTAMRLNADALGSELSAGGPPGADELRQRLQADLEGLELAVDELIKQAREVPGRVPARCDWAEVARERLEYWSVLSRSQRRAMDVRITPRQVEVGVSRDELEAAVDALLSNVFIHTPDGTAFRVTLARAAGDGMWSLTVANSKPARPAVGEPMAVGQDFQPSPASPRGTGLGLDIVSRTATQAGGRLSAGPTRDGGFRAKLTLPGLG